MRKTFLLCLTGLAAALAALSAVAATEDRDLSLGEMEIPEYGVTGLAPKTTVYPVTDAGSVDQTQTLAEGANWALEAWTVGRTLGEQPDDFRIGETCTALPKGQIDWVKTYAANNPTNHPGLIFNLDATNEAERVIFATTGPVKVNWVMVGQNENEPTAITYQIGRSVSARPYRLYATRADEGNLIAYIDLSGKYVRFFGDTNLVEKTDYGVVNGVTNAIVRGLDYNAQSGLLTYRYTVDEKTGDIKCTQGQFVMAYYDTESKERMVSHIVVEVTAPRVNTLTAHVGEELRPLGGGFGVAGLSPAVNSGTQTDADDPCSPYVETYETPESTASGDEKGQLKLYALAPTDASTSKLGMDMPWKVDVYWRAPDPMGTLWTFEDDWYLVTWPEGAPKVVTSGDAANPGYPLVLPSAYSASALNYRRPLYMNVTCDNSTHRVTASDTGRFVLRLTVGENGRPYFLPVECVSRTDARVCAEEAIPWPVGREITLCRGEDAGSAAAVAERMDASLPGYIHVPGSEGRNWNPKLYHFDSGSAVDGMLGSVTENNAFASLVSSIYGVNESAYPIEVWWSGSYAGDADKGNALPEPVTYPGFVQKYTVNWALAELENLYPTIHLYSQKGSADETMLAVQSLGLLLAGSNSSATVTKDLGVRFKAHERLHLGFSISSMQLDDKLRTVRCGRVATVRDTANRRVALEISVTEADSNGYTVVTRGAGFETTSTRYEHLAWNDYAVEVPPKLADTQLEISFGSTGVNGEPAAVNIALDDLACWHGEPDGPKDIDNAEFYFAFSEEDADTKKDAAPGLADALHGKTVAAILGACSLTCRNCDFTLGAPSPYYGLFSAENGIEPELYYQNDRTQIGYNPNEEHALMEKTDDGYVAWALRNDLNFEDTSHAMIFVQYAEDGKGKMDSFRIGAVPGQLTDEDYRQSKKQPVLRAPLLGAPNLGKGKGDDTTVTPKPSDPHAAGAFTNTVVVGSPLLVPKPLRLVAGYGTGKDTAYTVIWRKKDANPVYKDRKNQFWARCEGLVDVNYYYPINKGLGFEVPLIGQKEVKEGTLIGWMNNVGKGRPTAGSISNDVSKAWTWECVWPDTNGVPTMRIGQVLTKAEKGLPEMWNAASMAVTYPMSNDEGKGLVNLIDPTAAQTAALEIKTGDFPNEYGFTVGTTGNCTLRKGKYYFTGCPPSVSDRFYIDANAAVSNRMVLVGDLVEKESGGSYLRLNVLSKDERESLKALCKLGRSGDDCPKARWDKAVDGLATKEKKVSTPVEKGVKGFLEAKKEETFVVPENVSAFRMVTGHVVYKSDAGNVVTAEAKDLNKATWEISSTKFEVTAGSDEYKAYKEKFEKEIQGNFCTGKWDEYKKGEKVPCYRHTVTYTWLTEDRSLAIPYEPKDHLALIATGENYDKGWVTLVENDDPDPTHVAEGLPVQMHVIRVAPELHSDGIAVVTDPLNKLSEKLSLLYKSPLGDAAQDFEFEWRRAKPSADGTLDRNKGNVEVWQTYALTNGLDSVLLGQNGANPDEYVNTYYTLRYRPVKGTEAYTVVSNALAKAKKYVNDDSMWSAWAQEQLAEGWLQRVLNSVTPFAQRVEDFYANPSDIGYTMLEQIGKPYTGDVALNNDNLTEVGLLELYQTLFNRAEMLLSSMDGADADLSKQLILAMTRMGEFYTLLGAEAYADAKNPLIQCADGESYPSGTFSFANQVPTLLDEELALLRGRAALPALPRVTEAPLYNRLAWNLTKGLTEGEAAYVNNYGIRARNGVLDVNCAAAQYPQGHGDAWGHYLSALTGYYRLLRNPKFAWTAAMGEMLMDQKLVNVDYQDEQKFADAAVKLVQTGLDTFDLSWRKSYEDGGDGYFDANSEQAFGCGEWATRTGLAAAYGWMTANALLPTNNAPYQAFTDRGIMKIDRTTATQLPVLCQLAQEVGSRLAAYDAGMNPLGLSENAIPFDIDPDQLAAKNSHFEQILVRAERALANCRTVLDYAGVYGARLRQLQNDETEAIDAKAKTELAYENQLIAIYGTPFAGDIGPGGTYPQGYEGPDLYNYNYMDLSVYGLEGLDTTFTNTFKLYYAPNNGTLGQADEKQEIATINYTVTAGGIRVKPATVTGVRATEGSIQSAYRSYILAYQALQEAIGAYDIAKTAMDKAAADTKEAISKSVIISSVGIANAILDALTDKSAEIDEARDSLMYMCLERISEKQQLPGLAAAGVVALIDGRSAVSAVADAEASGTMFPLLVDLTALYASQKSTVINKGYWLIAKTALETSWEWSSTIRDLGKAFVGAVEAVNTAAQAVQSKVAALSAAEAAYRAEVYKGELIQSERELWRQQLSNGATASRYLDMYSRVQRNLALTKYTTAFDTAQRYVWELAKVYDYETGLLSADPQSGKRFLSDIIATRSLGQDGVSIDSATTDGGLYDVVNRLKANWDVLKPRLGINNPDKPSKWFSLRRELFRIKEGAEGDAAWRKELAKYRVDNILTDPDFVRHCQPPASANAVVFREPGYVIPFSTSINNAENFFGKTLQFGDHQFSSSDYATKIDAVGVDLVGLGELPGGADAEPNIYLVPVGRDYMRAPTEADRALLGWDVVDQVLPLPYAVGSTQLDDPDWISTFSGLDGTSDSAAVIRRHSTLRAGADFKSTRLVGRSAWNDRWIIVIPASAIDADREKAMNLIESGVKDVKLGIRAYARQGN